jgi:hypothetical protein
MPTPTRTIVSVFDPALRARIVRRVPMHYTHGADAATDRPAFVRAASSMAWVGDRIAMVQDDVNFVALVNPADGAAQGITLPAGKDGKRQFDDGRGTKKYKLDLEAMARVPTNDGQLLLAFGSGSKKRRENVMLLPFTGRGSQQEHGDASIVPLSALYAALREKTAFSGSEMNIEGAVYLNGVVRLFGRGNGESSDELHPLDATCDLAWPALRAHLDAPDSAPVPEISRITQYELGEIDGVSLGFTDAIPVQRTRVMYAAAAEASENAVDDGAVAGSALGVLPHDRRQPARWTAIRDEKGKVFRGKVEGLVLHPSDAMRALVVIDVDDYERPSELCEVALEGPW